MNEEGFYLGTWVVLGFICGLICSGIADHKSRSATGWFFLGFLFGPLAILAVAVTSPIREATDYSLPKPDTSKADELAKLAELRDRGVLTEDEFSAQKAKLL